ATAGRSRGSRTASRAYASCFSSSRRRHTRSYGDWSSEVCSSDLDRVQYRFAAVVAAIAGGSMKLPPVLHTIAILLVAVLAGMAYAAIPAILKVTRGVSEVIATIMLNSIVGGIIAYLINPDQFGVQTVNNIGTRAIEPSGQIPGIPLGSGTLFGFLFIAALIGAAYWFMLNRTRFGFELKASGEATTAAAAGGVNAQKMTLLAM